MTKRQCVDRVTKTRWRYSRDLLRVEATADLDNEAKGLAVASPLRFFFGSITKTTRRRGLQRGVEKCQIARRQTDDEEGSQVMAKGRRRCVLWRDEATGAHEAQEPKAKVEKDTGQRSRPSVVVGKPKQSKAK